MRRANERGASARVRRRFVAAMGLGSIGLGPVGIALSGGWIGCAEQPAMVSAPLYEGDASVLLASLAVDAGRGVPTATATIAKTAIPLPAEPVAPGYAYSELRECRNDFEAPSRAELPAPFEACPRRSPTGGQFTALATRRARANDPDACCYVTFVPRAVPGRALRDAEGRATSAATLARGDWTARLRPDVALPAAVRAALAEAWLADAALEHASIASFARFALDLVAHGAPPELVAAASAAAADEIAHARIAYGLASAYAGRALGPAPLDVAHRASDVASLVRATFADGCVGETIAALEAREAARVARDPVVRRALARIARDEERHAELAWRAVAWAVRARGADARGALAEAVAAIRVGATDAPRGLEAHGRLGADARRRVAERAVAAIIEPCAAALLRVSG